MVHDSHQPPVSPPEAESARHCAHHLRVWLAVTGQSYGSTARESFVRAHPFLFGRAYEYILRGYERWRARHGVGDSFEAFVGHIATRHERWRTTSWRTAAMAPCLI